MEWAESEGLVANGFYSMDAHDFPGEEFMFLLYFIVTMIVISAMAVGAAAVPMIIAYGTGGSGKSSAMAIAGIAMALALTAPILLLALQPVMMQKDEKELDKEWEVPEGNSPFESFWGREEWNDNGTIYSKWGPDMGWYLSIGAGGMFLVSMVLTYTSYGSYSSGSSYSSSSPEPEGKKKKRRKKKGAEDEYSGSGLVGPSALMDSAPNLMSPPTGPLPPTAIPAQPILGDMPPTGPVTPTVIPTQPILGDMAPPAPAPRQEAPSEVACPQCNTTIQTPTTRPAQIQCPNCGLKGTIN